MNINIKPKNIIDKFFSVVELKSLKGLTVVLAAVCVIMLISLGYAYQNNKEPTVVSEYKDVKSQSEVPLPSPTPSPEQEILVHIKGEVKSPGLYNLKKGCRCAEAIETAGGFTDNADPDGVNLAKIIADGSEINVPSKKAKSTKSSGSSGSHKTVTVKIVTPKPEGIININTASIEELDTLPGIGPIYASRIYLFRQQCGPYKTIEDVMKVKGIGRDRFELFRAYIKV